MAYQIDFTASNYTARSARKWMLRLLALVTAGGIAYGVHDAYVTYNEPTLNMRLAEYESAARPIEEMNAAWDLASREYETLVRYHRLVWAANPTNFIDAMAAENAPRLARGLRPQGWTLTTGGACDLTYRYVFGPSDKAEQVEGLEDTIAQAVTSIVAVVDGRVDVSGVRHERLLNVDDLNVTVRFALPDAKAFPTKEASLASCVKDIDAFRKRLQEKTPLKNEGGNKSIRPTLRVDEVMREYLPTGKDKPGFPVQTNVIDVAGWFGRADAFVLRNHIPGGDIDRKTLKAMWNVVGDARFPWQRYRALDNEALVADTKALETISDAVKRFKGFLEQRHLDSQKRLEPFVDAYSHDDVFNRPVVDSDLRERVAKGAGIARARASFDESGFEAAVLDKPDEKFTFSWVRWTLALGDGVGREAERNQPDAAADKAEPITLVKLADCIRRALTLGPGYALTSVKVTFGADGNVAGALLEGLLPVKKVETKKVDGKKEAVKDVR